MFDNTEDITQEILENINLDIDKSEGSFLYNMIAPISNVLMRNKLQLEDILSLGFIETGFDEYLDRRVYEVGLTRKQGEKATGTVKFIGQDGTTIQAGTLLKFDTFFYKTLDTITLPNNSTSRIIAENIGKDYNRIPQTEFTLADRNTNITSIITELGILGGADKETDSELRERYELKVRNEATSGNVENYKLWALENEGVGSVKVVPLWAGAGTVKVLIGDENNKPVDTLIVNRTQEHIEKVMPIGCTLTVRSFYPLTVNIEARINLTNGITDTEMIKEKLTNSLNEYIKTIDDTFYYSKVFGFLAEMEEVEDLQSLTLNGNTSNITTTGENVIIIGDINLIEV